MGSSFVAYIMRIKILEGMQIYLKINKTVSSKLRNLKE